MTLRDKNALALSAKAEWAGSNAVKVRGTHCISTKSLITYYTQRDFYVTF